MGLFWDLWGIGTDEERFFSLGMGGALRKLLLLSIFLLVLAKTELASYQTNIAEEEIPEERAGDEEEPGEIPFPSGHLRQRRLDICTPPEKGSNSFKPVKYTIFWCLYDINREVKTSEKLVRVNPLSLETLKTLLTFETLDVGDIVQSKFSFPWTAVEFQSWAERSAGGENLFYLLSSNFNLNSKLDEWKPTKIGPRVSNQLFGPFLWVTLWFTIFGDIMSHYFGRL